jgi:hypothetical protein
MLRLEAPVTFQVKVLDPPLAIKPGVAVKLLMLGNPAVSVTIVLALTDPALFVAVRVKVVVAAGLTDIDVPVRTPTLGLMLRLDAPVTFQDRVLD